MDLQTWQGRLRENGFSGTDLVLDNYHTPHNTTSVLVTTRLEQQAVKSLIKSTGQEAEVIYLLYDTYSAPPLSRQTAAEFERRGATCKAFTLDSAIDTVPVNARMVAFLSSKNDLFDADEHRLKSFQHLARSVQSMLWITPGGIIKGQNPRNAFMTGLLRVIATENPAGRFLSINTEGDNFERGSDDLVRGIVNKEFALQAEELGEGSIDSEFAWQDGCMRVSRVVPDAGLRAYSERIRTPTRQGFQILYIDSYGPINAAFETVGILKSLYFRPYKEFLQPLPVNYIDFKVATVGLNWKDVIIATGRNSSAGSSLSSEYAGVVTKVGANVVGLSGVYGVGKGRLRNYK